MTRKDKKLLSQLAKEDELRILALRIVETWMLGIETRDDNSSHPYTKN
ncbi:UNVERIFIED_CONTAM: hypothetical protein ABID98_001892 [Brevibacillus sp. OAP136]